MNTTGAEPDMPRTLSLFLLLFAIGCAYLASLGYFLATGKDFVDTEKLAAATAFAQSMTLTLPAKLTFQAKSEWTHALVTGWNRPNGPGAWSNRRAADVLLPALAETSSKRVCINATLHGLKRKSMPRWPMAITVNGQPLAPLREFTDAGPFIIQGSVVIAREALIHVWFFGPTPRISNLMSKRSFNPNAIGFHLSSISITLQCAKR